MRRYAMTAVGLFALTDVTLAAETSSAAPPASQNTTPAEPTLAVPAAEVSGSPTSAGLRAYVDPATGQLRQPTDAERASEATLPPRSDRSKVWIETLPDGQKMLHTERQLMMPVVATVDSAGKVVVECDPKDVPQDGTAESPK